MSDQLLFSPSLIDESARSSVPDGYTVRPLSRNDHCKGFFECLQSLTWTGQVTEARFHERFDWMTSKGEGWFYNVVLEHEGKIVGTGVVIVERKFIWDLGTIGHVEDVSILKAHQGKGLGKCLVQALDSVARNVGCNRNLLDCSEKNQGFYAKCGYESGGSTVMKHYFETPITR